ncbi:MAG: hypothetical protein N3A65_09695 [candidate division WOR-3 bacterium]|nr:hypothetical protein [candidate division WOR-3 bacterium]
MFRAIRKKGGAMQLKKINNWFTRVLLICFLALVYIGGWCQNPHQTNPNLKLLVGDTIYHSTHNFNPVVSTDGEKVFYLTVSVANWSGFYEQQIGSIYCVNIDGSNSHEILAGKYNNLAISPDGKKLACQSYKGEYDEPRAESLIVIVDLTQGNVESLWISSKEPIKKLVWSNDGDHLYYLTSNAITRLYLPDSTEEVVLSVNGIVGFDLFSNDSIYLDSTIWYPEIESVNQHYVIGTSDIFSQKFIMREIQKDTLFTLPDSLAPYSFSWVGQPYWLPDGNKIIFSAAEIGGGSPGLDPAEIWILENIFEQIEE